ncbi:MAG: ribosome biogenesis factor YjgA [Burkholderiales bacterium]|nr:ribosome biogenesis factor YjgA [Burkholderiales bacterium]
MDNNLPPSKSQRKRQMTELQDMGAELLDLSVHQLAQIELPDNLYDAVIDARQITKFEARRRQLQYIGKLMRTIDPEPIRAQLDLWKNTSDEHKAWLHHIERWRDRLLVDETALNELVGAHPQADIQQLRTLIRNTLRERELNKPPKSYRALFQMLRELMPLKLVE